MNIELLHGDCLEIMPTLDADSVDSIVTDPPYGLSFMGKDWDHGVPGEHFWREALRVAKPGAHLLAFGGTRTFHRLTVAIEDAGWEIRDCVMWVYGSGFPKSLDVSKAIDKASGVEREKVPATGGLHKNRNMNDDGWSKIGEGEPTMDSTTPATDAARQWQGWGTALKPAWEPIIVARKPLIGTVAENVQKYGTGAINVDGCRVDASEGRPLIESKAESSLHAFGDGLNGSRCAGITTQGRWPANLIHDGSDEVVRLFPSPHGAGFKQSGGNIPNGDTSMFGIGKVTASQIRHGDTGNAARFFYCAKASRSDRNEGCEELEEHEPTSGRREDRRGLEVSNAINPKRNHHPTVKPTALMQYLCRLVTPPSGIILDPFIGSGSTGKAALKEGFRFIGIEQNAEYIEIARARTAQMGMAL